MKRGVGPRRDSFDERGHCGIINTGETRRSVTRRTHDRGETIRVGNRDTSPSERLHVASDGNPVQLDGLLDRGRRQRQRANLKRGPDEEHVCRRGVAEERTARTERIKGPHATVTNEGPDHRLHGIEVRIADIDVRHHVAGRCPARGHNGDRPGRIDAIEVRGGHAHDEIEHEVEIDRSVHWPVGAPQRLVGDAEVRHDGTGLLAQTGLIEPPHLTSVEARRGAE